MKKGNVGLERRYYVAKSNDLIRKTRYSLTAQQQKIILYAISKIRPQDPPSTQYEFSIEDMCKVCGLEIDTGGTYYKRIKEDLQKLTVRQWVKLPDKREMTVSWLGDAMIIPLMGTVTITFNPNMAPYLFDLRERYTQYRLENVLVFSSTYAIRLYELLRSYTTQDLLDNFTERETTIRVQDLRDLMNIDGYPRWADFHRYVIKKGVDEINTKSDDLHIEYSLNRQGRNIDSITFKINSARALQALTATRLKRRKLKE